MDKTRLSSKFKRVIEWKDYLSSHSTSEPVKIGMLAVLPKYESLLKEIWTATEVNSKHDAELDDLERQLDDLHEQARMFTAGR